MTDHGEVPRIAPLESPYDPAVATMLQKWMPPGSDIEPWPCFARLPCMGS